MNCPKCNQSTGVRDSRPATDDGRFTKTNDSATTLVIGFVKMHHDLADVTQTRQPVIG